MRAALPAFGVGLALAIFAACSSFDDGESSTTPDSGTNDAPSPIDATGADASPTNDGGTLDADAAEAGPPEGMILVTTPATSFWIDAREVSVGEFNVFKQKVVQLQNGDAGFPAVCATKVALGPSGQECNGRLPDGPVACVDWCDAFAYCQFAGKRLCGHIGGGPPVSGNDAFDWTKSEWMRACAGANGTNTWAYGAAGDAAACNSLENQAPDVIDSGSIPGCAGSEPGLFDMSGNVAELFDNCIGDAGGTDTCFAQGGSYVDYLYATRCADQAAFNRGTVAPYIGFRCCKDP